MKEKILLFLIIFLSINCYSQNNFKRGYYINNSDEKIECFIKTNSRLNPKELTYKLTEDLNEQIETIKSVKEFGIYDELKYVRRTIDIDTSSNILANLSNDLYPNFKEKEIFLNVLIEGKANLYSFENKSIIRYFYNVNNSDIIQLVYKRYKKINENVVRKNEEYKRQLWNDLKCENISINEANKLEYKKQNLVDFFIKYNTCSRSEFLRFDKKGQKSVFNITIRPGLTSSSLSLHENSTRKTTDFDDESGFRLGLEAEFIINSIKANKWAIFVEPTYQFYKSRKEWQNASGQQTYYFNIDYKSVEIPIGIRHYFSLNRKSKIFANGAILFDIPFNSSLNSNFSPGHLDIETKFNFAFGLGYKYHNKFSLELRSMTNRNLTSHYLNWKADYNTLSIIIGYTLL
ncbi:tRNA modification GTPase [Mariniflexile jejuense]|uniref:tRNA modification GTPase n=1 Tax=Mariniflexile jejuense TaxID=1173582 RepID=A0ABW3JMZ5_9FLAO